MKKLILATLVTLITTSAFAEVVCQTEDLEFTISISAGDINSKGIAPVTEIKVLQGNAKKAIKLEKLSGGFTSYTQGVVQGSARGNTYSVKINSMDMHVLKVKNDSLLKVSSLNGRRRAVRLTCMTDGD